MLKMVEVPLANGMKSELLEGTLVKVNYRDRLVSFAHVAEDGYELVGFAGDVAGWKDCYVAEVYEKVDLPDAIVELSQTLGAVYKSRTDPQWSMVCVGDGVWIDNKNVIFSNFLAKLYAKDPAVYLATKGVHTETEKRLTVWKDVEGDYWTTGVDKGYRMWVGHRWGVNTVAKDPFKDYAPLFDATDEFYEKYPEALERENA